jgi:twitching motility two-component system response regulator PilH
VSLKVLLADDSMTAQNMGKKILAESGYDVTTVSNGAAAVKKIAEVKPDVVILDIYMPGYTGLEVCERVRANMDTANLPVLLTVGKMEPYRAEDGAKVRADGVIVKPFEATDLLALVKKMAEKTTHAARRVVPEPVPEAAEEVGQPEPAMPTAVEVPSEMADAPALAMEEFDSAPAHMPEFNPTMEWTAAPEHPAAAVAPEPHLAEVPWTFDQATVPTEPVVEAAPLEPTAASEIEFTSAPQAGNLEVQLANGLDANIQPTGEVEITTDPALTSPLEMTDFVTSFGETTDAAVGNEEVIAEVPTIDAPAEGVWDGWANAAPEPVSEAAAEPEMELSAEPASDAISHVADEAAPEAKPVIEDFEAKVAAAMAGFSVDSHAAPEEEHQEPAAAVPPSSLEGDDFEARVAAAMSGFALEPAEAAHEATEDTHAPAPTHTVADDFEARVAAAMSGFAAEAAQPEPLTETPAEPSVEAHAEPPVEEAHVEATPAPTVAQDDFEARLAQALSAFDAAPEASSLHEPSAATPEPPVEMQEHKSSVQFNETMVLPHEAMLSLEAEMKQALDEHVRQAAEATAAPVAPAAESAAEPEPEPGPASFETHVTETEVVEEPAHMEPAPPQLPEVAAAAFAAATSAVPAEEVKPSSDKFADAVQRAIERLKPQLIAEIVKELKGE